MPIEPKPFQRAAIDAALRALTNPRGSRKYLIADEVGLGKTIVASGVLEALSERLGRPLCVFYVCSNLVLARQNKERLAGFLPEDERASAIANVDRPSLLPIRERPDNQRLWLFSLSPATALPNQGNRVHGGRVEERALAAVLLDYILPERPDGLHDALRLAASPGRFNWLFELYSNMLVAGDLGGAAFVAEFRRSLRNAFNLAEGQHLPPRVGALIEKPTRLAATMRSALAAAALATLKPDLVVLDEFQKFRDLLDVDAEGDDAAAARVLEAIRGGGDNAPALLLLSATPYVPYRSRTEGEGSDAVGDFYRLIEFLAGACGPAVRRETQKHFSELDEELRKGAPDAARIATLRAALETRLRPLMCRTERSRLHATPLPHIERTNLHPSDLRVFRNFAESVDPRHDGWVVPLWSSVPLPMQTLGPRYHAWTGANPERCERAATLRREQRTRLQPLEPVPHPRLRGLLRAAPAHRLMLPWVAPSIEWWSLGGPWNRPGGDVDGKLLVFTRYRAAPGAIAGLVSYAVETAGRRRRIRGEDAWDSATTRSLLPADPDRPGLLSLFHPSPLLAALDPLQARRAVDPTPGKRSWNLALQSMASQLRNLLRRERVEVRRGNDGRTARPVWRLVAALENRMGLWVASDAAWRRALADVRNERDVEGAGRRLEGMVDRWRAAALAEVTSVSEEELRELAKLALEGPGIVLARALRRHWPDALGNGLGLVASVSWRGLRTYLDKPWFAAALGGGRAENFPEVLRSSVVEGNLEAVLDEHFWYVAQADLSGWPSRLEDFERALRLRAGNTSLHVGREDSFTLRCHAAAAMTDARVAAGPVGPAGQGGEIQLRPEEVRNAFNTPFWPHVLVTTSIGQEGLDFHPWCRAVAHWDLPAGPVALEQREGRITRHASLAVRRAMGHFGERVRPAPGESPWRLVAQRADQEMSDATGLSPWWTARGAVVQRLLLSTPGSEIDGKMASLARERAVYRLALGMPNQVDLVALLISRGGGVVDNPEEVCLDLSAFRQPGLRR